MIHEKAHVEVDLPESVSVWQFASVIRGASVGEQCSIGACAIVDGATIGDGCSIGHAASVHPGSSLGRGVFVGPGAVLCNDAWPRTHKKGWQTPEQPTVIVEDGASIGANATVLPGIRIGRNAMVAAGAVVTCDVPGNHVFLHKGEIRRIMGEPQRLRYAKALAR